MRLIEKYVLRAVVKAVFYQVADFLPPVRSTV